MQGVRRQSYDRRSICGGTGVNVDRPRVAPKFVYVCIILLMLKCVCWLTKQGCLHLMPALKCLSPKSSKVESNLPFEALSRFETALNMLHAYTMELTNPRETAVAVVNGRTQTVPCRPDCPSRHVIDTLALATDGFANDPTVNVHNSHNVVCFRTATGLALTTDRIQVRFPY